MYVMVLSIRKTPWLIAPDWVFHHHTDQTCTAYNSFSGAVLALNEANAWVLRQLASAPMTTENLELALAKYEDVAVDAELSDFLQATLSSLSEDARLVRLAIDS